MAKKILTKEGVLHLAKLAQLFLTDAQVEKFSNQLSSVLDYMSKIQKLPTEGVKETTQVTGITNVMREDEVDELRMFTQEEALLNAKETRNGYFVVDAVF